MVYIITKENYFDLEQPAKSEELFNVIEVPIKPLVPDPETEQEVYRSETAIDLIPGEEKEMIIEFNTSPVIDCEGTPDEVGGLNIIFIAEEYYAWGAKITVKNNDVTAGSCIIVVTATPLNAAGEEIVTDSNAASISENGNLKYTFPGNQLIQDRALGQDIAAALLSSYSTARKDVTLTWRGDPAIELVDEIQVPEYQKHGLDVQGIFRVFKNKLDFDGALSSTTDGRKMMETIPSEEPVTAIQDTISTDVDEIQDTTIEIESIQDY